MDTEPRAGACMALGARMALGALLAVAAGFGGCIPSNVVAREDRAVDMTEAEPTWSEDGVASVEGLFESVRIEGEAAAQLWRIAYLFEPTGRYTASALVQAPVGPSFQTLDGTYALTPEGLVLDDAEPVAIRRSADGRHLRLDADGGVVVLRQVDLR